MQQLKWPAIALLLIIAGYVVLTATEPTVEQPAASLPPIVAVTHTESSPDHTATVAMPIVSSAAEQTAPVAQSSSATPQAAPAETPPAEAIASDEIDNVLPYPFNTILKSGQRNDLQNYKRFAEANDQDEWDKTMQAHLTDIIYASPYLNKLKIESITCKGNMCEIRVFDQSNQNAWQNIMDKIVAQPWWESPVLSTYLFSLREKDSDVAVPGYLILFPRKH